VGEEIVVTVAFKAIGVTSPLADTSMINIAFSENAEDENTNQVSDGDESALTVGAPPITAPPEEAPVGGLTVPVSKLTVLTPYIILVGLIGLVFSTYYLRKRSKV
jgi:hypothetical protein